VKKVRITTDGACEGNPGPGGWAAILRYGPHTKEIYGFSPHTTNNRMELTAAIEGLRALKQPCEAEVVTDSEYLKNGITTWIHKWKKNGWRKGTIKNQDLWEELDRLANQVHKTRWVWVRGHANHQDNNRADELATGAARRQACSV